MEYTKLMEQVLEREGFLKKEWVDKAEIIWKTYSGDKADETPFNILYSNTEILVPAIFSQAPVPLVKRRFDNQAGDMVAKAAERMASYCMDTNIVGYPCYVDALEAAVLDAALPGQGQIRLRVVEGIAQIDYVHWDRFTWGYARRWEDVPWVAFGHDKFPAEIIEEFKLSEDQAKRLAKPDTSGSDESDKAKKAATLRVHEVWDRKKKEVLFLCDAYEGKILGKAQPDPLQLDGFFPCPAPLKFLAVTGDLMPRPLYNLYKQQAEELNHLTGRIKKITSAIRVRGIYNGNLPEIERILAEDSDNAMISASAASVMSQDGGLDKMIWMVPIEKLVATLKELYVAREQVKAAIYEILGVGDILRGVSKASETLGAQQIKDKWGSLRVNKARERVSRFVRDSVRMLVEAAAKHTPEQTWAEVTALPMPSSIQVAVLRKSGQPAPPESWESILTTLKSSLTRSYTVDIETNSTVDSEATQDKQDVTEFMTAMGQTLQGLAPLSATGPSGFEASKQILIEFCKKFRMGPDVQKILQTLEPPPQGQSPEAQKAQEELQKAQQDLQTREQALQQREQTQMQQAMQAKEQMGQMTEQLKNMQMELREAKAELERREAALTLQEESLRVAEREAVVGLQEKSLGLKEQAVGVDQKSVALESKSAKLSTDATSAEQKITGRLQELEGMLSQTEVAGKKEENQALMALVEANMKTLETVTESLTKVLGSINSPVKITKNPDGSFTRTSSPS